jgi:hypothetical protein
LLTKTADTGSAWLRSFRINFGPPKIELEAEVASYRERADRAEQWLHRVYTEIEDRFLQLGRPVSDEWRAADPDAFTLTQIVGDEAWRPRKNG